MENTETIFSRTEAEYRREDALRKLYRELFDVLKGMESIGQYGTQKWAEVFSKYADAYKKVNGYRPHWAH